MGSSESTAQELCRTPPTDGLDPKDKKSEEKEKKTVPISNYWRILSFGSRNDHALLLVAAAMALGSGVAMPLMNIVFGRLVGNFNTYFIPGSGVTEAEFKHTVSKNALFIVYLFIGKFVLTYISTFCFRTVGLRISASLRLSYMQALLSQPISKLDQVSSGTVSNTITMSANTIQASITDKLSHLFQGFALLIAAYAIAFTYSWQLTLATSSALLFICLVLSFVATALIKGQSRVDEADAKHASIAGEVFSAVRTVLSLGAEDALSKKYCLWVDESRTRALKIAPLAGAHLSPVFFAMYASFALAFWFGLKLYREGHITSVTNVIVVIFSVLLVVSILGNIIAPLMMIYKAISASSEFFDMIDSEQIPNIGKTSPEVSAHQDIVFDDVSFSYPARPGVPVLQNFSARFEKGKKTALVGPSGSGKSTIVALLERWYELGEAWHEPRKSSQSAETTEEAGKDPSTILTVERQSFSSGTITCGNVDINDFQRKWWRTQIGLVQQEPFLFNATIFENVASGLIGTLWESSDDNTKIDLVKSACKEAFADEFIEKLPKAYYTMVGESGIKLSGGQRQRIAIARSVIRQPAILVLDEATSSIDVRSERIVQKALDRISKSRTTITIAHRLATIQEADHIIVLRDGRNIEEGTHDELMAVKDGLYHALVQAQRLELHSTEGIDESEEVIAELQEISTRQSEQQAEEQHDQLTDPSYKQKGFFMAFGRFVKEQKALYPLYVLLLVGIIMAGAAFSLQSYLFAQIIQVFTYTGSRLVHAANFWSLMFFVLALGIAVAYFIVGVASQTTASRFGAACRKGYFLDILRKPISFYDEESNASGALMSRLSSDPKQLQELLSWNGVFPMISIFNLIGCVAISFSFGWKLTLVALFAAMPVVLASQFIRIRQELQFEARNSAVFSESSTFATEAVSAMRTVVSLTMEDTINNRYSKLLHQQIRDSTKRASYAMLFAAFCDSVELLAMALTFWYGGQLLASHEYNPVQFFVIYIAIIQGSQGAGQFLGISPNMAQATASANRILSLRPTSQEARVTSTKTADLNTPAHQGASLELRNVTFQYHSRETPVFRNLSINIASGQFAAFVGASGCGKTSTISLIERFYDPSSGVILMNGIDVQSVDLATYRKQLSLVAQEPKLFQGTIRENLLLGVDSDSVTEEQMFQACKDAEIHDVIISLPDGYDTDLGMSSSTALSGGQKQRLCLARALLRSPKLLLLDEATSSLDSQSEKLVQAAIERIAKQRAMTVIAVAHRLATIQKADCIFVFAEGEPGLGTRVVEKGTHQELIAMRGVYWGMCQGQALDR